MNDRRDHRQDRANDMRDRMTDRRDDWRDYRDDRWDNRRDRWDDWSDNYWDHHYDHWPHDHWHGHYDRWWDHMWNYHPVAMGFGLTAWGVNRMNYWFGYSQYYNPYYVEPYPVGGNVVINYSEPLTTYQQVSVASASATPQSASPPDAGETSSPLDTAFDAARTAFYDGDYATATTYLNQALVLAKDDAVLHEFRSLLLFAEGKYRESAAAIHAVLAVGPGWDWTTLSSMYPSVDVYTEQLRALETAVKADPSSADMHFLLAYHYVTTNATDAAIEQLKDVLKLQPKDAVAAQVLQMIAGPEALPASLAAAPPKPAGDVPAVDPKSVVGDWKANGEGGATFKLSLTPDSAFTWTYSQGGQTTTVAGAYAIDGNTLAMEPDEGGTMVAEVTPPANGKFHFQAVGSPPGDQGLDFTK